MGWKSAVLLTTLVVVLPGCTENEQEPQSMQFETDATLYHGLISCRGTSDALSKGLLANEAQFSDFWNDQCDPQVAKPGIDFNQEVVAFFAWGVQPRVNDRIEFEGSHMAGDVLVVRLSLVSYDCGPDMAGRPMFVGRFDDRGPGSVEFVTSEERVSC